MSSIVNVLDHPDFDSHETIHFVTDRSSGLRALIGIHSTMLGPAAGGCRMLPYTSAHAALTDVLRLSRGMSYKNAIAGLPMGGGKAVIIGDFLTDKKESLLDSYARAVTSLGGRYVTAEDVGITVRDIAWIAKSCPYVTGLHETTTHGGGDPAPKTAHGVHLGIRAAVQFALQRGRLRGLKVGIQGVGAVGMALAERLHSEGAILFVADRSAERAAHAAGRFNATVLDQDGILEAPVDILAPCALGAILNDGTIARLRASIICGAANNQLATSADGERLRTRGILYAPDYVVNAGGIISVSAEYLKHQSAAETTAQIERIPETLTRIFERAAAEKRSTSEVADELARSILGVPENPDPRKVS
jgi:leucine dehydrogenase